MRGLPKTEYLLIDPLTGRAVGVTKDPARVAFVRLRRASRYQTRGTAECIRRIFGRTIPEVAACIIVPVADGKIVETWITRGEWQ